MAVTITLAYCNTATIMDVISFTVQGPGAILVKLFSSPVDNPEH